MNECNTHRKMAVQHITFLAKTEHVTPVGKLKINTFFGLVSLWCSIIKILIVLVSFHFCSWKKKFTWLILYNHTIFRALAMIKQITLNQHLLKIYHTSLCQQQRIKCSHLKFWCVIKSLLLTCVYISTQMCLLKTSLLTSSSRF